MKHITVKVEDAEGFEYELTDCECDNTHEQNDTVCRYCWALGKRHYDD